MHIYFSGIGGVGIGPLSLIAHKAGFDVTGSDKQDSSYIHYLNEQGVTATHIGQTYEHIAEVHAEHPIDWFVYSSAVDKENADHPELRFCREHGIRASHRDEFIEGLITEKHLKMIAIAGTHGKTTTTAMAIWLCKRLGIAESHSVGGKMSFADMGEFDPKAEYFIYEADEYDRNFLTFHPHLSIITGIDWDHPDIYPTRKNYYEAFDTFLHQSKSIVMWDEDLERINASATDAYTVLPIHDAHINETVTLAGLVNRQNAWEVAQAFHVLTGKPLPELLAELNRFPGIGRRFEEVAPRIYSDYAHTPPKIRGALQLAHEVAGDNVVVVYEGLHNTRQHFIKDELKHLFDSVKELYIVPSYLAREDENLPLLTPKDLKGLLDEGVQMRAQPAALDDALKTAIQQHADDGDLVLCITAGGGGSLDEWLKKNFSK